MTTDVADANVTLLTSTLAALNDGDLETCLARIHPELLMTLAGAPGQLQGRDIWLAGVQTLRAGFPDVRVEIEDVFGSGDRVAVRTTITGTHLGVFEGVEPTGRRIRVMSNEFYRVVGGIVVEEWVVSDLATLMDQITGPDSER